MRSLVILPVMLSLLGCSSKPSMDRSNVDSNARPDSTSREDASSLAPGSDPTSDSTVFVIDVRSKAEWDSGHVAKAVHIPHTEIGDRISEVTGDKNAKIVVYCKVGGRAQTAKNTLEEVGFTNVENGGGFDDVKDRFQEQEPPAPAPANDDTSGLGRDPEQVA